MSETKTLLRAEPKSETYSYKIEQTAEHLTVVRLVRNADRKWHYHVTAERLIAATAGQHAGDTVQGDSDGYTTADEAIVAARKHARMLLAGDGVR